MSRRASTDARTCAVQQPAPSNNMDCLRGALQGDYLSFVYKGGSDPARAGRCSLNAQAEHKWCTGSGCRNVDDQASATNTVLIVNEYLKHSWGLPFAQHTGLLLRLVSHRGLGVRRAVLLPGCTHLDGRTFVFDLFVDIIAHLPAPEYLLYGRRNSGLLDKGRLAKPVESAAKPTIRSSSTQFHQNHAP